MCTNYRVWQLSSLEAGLDSDQREFLFRVSFEESDTFRKTKFINEPKQYLKRSQFLNEDDPENTKHIPYLNIVSASTSANQTVRLGEKFSPVSSTIAISPPPLIWKSNVCTLFQLQFLFSFLWNEYSFVERRTDADLVRRHIKFDFVPLVKWRNLFSFFSPLRWIWIWKVYDVFDVTSGSTNMLVDFIVNIIIGYVFAWETILL